MTAAVSSSVLEATRTKLFAPAAGLMGSITIIRRTLINGRMSSTTKKTKTAAAINGRLNAMTEEMAATIKKEMAVAIKEKRPL